MSTYCNANDETTLYYSFAGDKVDRVMQFTGTINVASGDNIPGWIPTENFLDVGYRLNYHSTPTDRGPSANDIVLDFYYSASGQSYPPMYIHVLLCSDVTPRIKQYEAVDSNYTIDYNTKCSGKSSTDCMIKVSQQGKIVFSDYGACPTKYHVGCGDCPKGFCKCHTDSYPGYCCLDCSAVAAKIQSITNKVKGINHG